MRLCAASARRFAFAVAVVGLAGAKRAAAQATGVMQATVTVVDLSTSDATLADARRELRLSAGRGVTGPRRVRSAGGRARIDVETVRQPPRSAPGRAADRLRVTVTYLD